MIKLSILIATMPSRKQKFESGVLHSLLVQSWLPNKGIILDIEIIVDDSLDYNIGVKRNKLLEKATGDYIIFADDDDSISSDYIEKILKATETNPDCIGISGTITFNGGPHKQWHISKEYGSWYQKGAVYYRTPNHISPVRRELALQVGFPEISFGEDAEYSKRLLPLLHSEVVIPGNLYHYDYQNPKK